MNMTKLDDDFIDIFWTCHKEPTQLVKDNFKIPVFAYQVSGEYSLIKKGIMDKILDEDAIIESLASFKRAGASAVVTYFADIVAKKLR